VVLLRLVSKVAVFVCGRKDVERMSGSGVQVQCNRRGRNAEMELRARARAAAACYPNEGSGE
jgi:hypothetical protein